MPAMAYSRSSAFVATGIGAYLRKLWFVPLRASKLLEGCLPARTDTKQGSAPADASDQSHGTEERRRHMLNISA